MLALDRSADAYQLVIGNCVGPMDVGSLALQVQFETRGVIANAKAITTSLGGTTKSLQAGGGLIAAGLL
jgi:hypothetical protein